jgi:hypothetical protein
MEKRKASIRTLRIKTNREPTNNTETNKPHGIKGRGGGWNSEVKIPSNVQDVLRVLVIKF